MKWSIMSAISTVLIVLLMSSQFNVKEIRAQHNNITIAHLYDTARRVEFNWIKSSSYGEPCDQSLYNSLMKPVWDIFLKNPADGTADTEFNRVLAVANDPIGHPNASLFWSSICFSRSLERCSTASVCECMKVIDNRFKIDQVYQSQHCGQKAKLSCKPWEANPATKGASLVRPKLSIDCELYAKCNDKNICECAVGMPCAAISILKPLLFPRIQYILLALFCFVFINTHNL